MEGFNMEAKKKEFKGLFKAATTAGIDEQLAKINHFTRRPYAAEELYIGQMRLANNCIDRDNERYSESILKEFAKTVIRKSLLLDHDRRLSAAIGKFFDCEIEKISLAQAIKETGELLRLPEGIKEVHFLAPWFYIPKEAVENTLLSKLEAGICDFVSIGFRAEMPIPVTDTFGTIAYHEYRGKGEVTEGSIVYLGAQYGASFKAYGDNKDKQTTADWRKDNPLVPDPDRDRAKIEEEIERARSRNPLIPEQYKSGGERVKAQQGASSGTDWKIQNPLVPEDE
jgi:hypothetical protein